MKPSPSLLGLASMLGALAGSGLALPAEPLRVATRLPPGPYLVGQAIKVRVEVEGTSASPRIQPARLVGGEIHPAPGDGRFVVVAGRPGTLEISPFVAVAGDRVGTSRPIRLPIGNVPAQGRSTAFLGGVGEFELAAEAVPSSLRAGQTLEFRIRMTGPAAWGSSRAPDPSGWASIGPSLRVEPLPDVLEGADPAVRTFRYRLRPTRAGRVTIPPVAIAAFEPKARRYATKVTPGVPIQVEEPPRFDPDRIDYAAPGAADGRLRPAAVALGLGLVVALLATLARVAWGLLKRSREARRVDPRALALAMAGGLGPVVDESEAARTIVEALTTFLQRAGGRAAGALTPPEARAGIERLTDDREIAGLVEDLVRRCDRARYGRGGGDARRLIEEARALFERIAGVVRKGGRSGGEPREAAETA